MTWVPLAIAVFGLLGLAWLVLRILAGRAVAAIILATVVGITGLPALTQVPTPATGNPPLREDPTGIVHLPNEQLPPL